MLKTLKYQNILKLSNVLKQKICFDIIKYVIYISICHIHLWVSCTWIPNSVSNLQKQRYSVDRNPLNICLWGRCIVKNCE